MAGLARYLKPSDSWGVFRPGARSAAVMAMLYEREDELYLPFVLRRSDLPDHPGQVALPGGGVKAGEEAWDAAAREVAEEIGIAAAEIVPVGAGTTLYTAVSNFCVVPFVGYLGRRAPTFAPDAGEVAGVIEVPLARLLDGGGWSNTPERWFGANFGWQGSVIWGLTARILHDLLPRLGAGLGLGDANPVPPAPSDFESLPGSANLLDVIAEAGDSARQMDDIPADEDEG